MSRAESDYTLNRLDVPGAYSVARRMLHDFYPRLRQASIAAGRGFVADASARPFYVAATSGIARLHLATKCDGILDRFFSQKRFGENNLSRTVSLYSRLTYDQLHDK